MVAMGNFLLMKRARSQHNRCLHHQQPVSLAAMDLQQPVSVALDLFHMVDLTCTIQATLWDSRSSRPAWFPFDYAHASAATGWLLTSLQLCHETE
jgi:hypothetical protein